MTTKTIRLNSELAKESHRILPESGWLSRCCPVALALNQATGDKWAVGVCVATRLRDNTSFELPESLRTAVRDFDDNDTCPTIDVELDIPE